jgi:hypothetical protein
VLTDGENNIRRKKARFVSTTEVKNVPNDAPSRWQASPCFFAAQLLRTRRYFTEIS